MKIKQFIRILLFFVLIMFLINNKTFALQNIKTVQINLQGSNKTIKTKSYKINIPCGWSTQKIVSDVLVFKDKSKKIIGGVDVLAYYSDQPFHQLFPNHTEVIKSKKLFGFFTDVYEYKFEQMPPAAAKNTTVTYPKHFYYILKDKNIAYDLYFSKSDIKESVILKIAKSLKLR